MVKIWQKRSGANQFLTDVYFVKVALDLLTLLAAEARVLFLLTHVIDGWDVHVQDHFGEGLLLLRIFTLALGLLCLNRVKVGQILSKKLCKTSVVFKLFGNRILDLNMTA